MPIVTFFKNGKILHAQKIIKRNINKYQRKYQAKTSAITSANAVPGNISHQLVVFKVAQNLL
jgi:hypothetical protein